MEENKDVQNVNDTETVYDEGNNGEYDGEYYEESKVKTALRKIVSFVFNKKMIAMLLVLIVVSQVITGVVLGNVVTDPDTFVEPSKAEKIIRFPLSEPAYVKWLESNAEKIAMKNSDGKNLSGLSLSENTTSHSYIIICHPLTSNSLDMALYAHHFCDLGFNVIIPDSRGYGDSEYSRISFGYFEKNDILDWVNGIIKKDVKAKIFLFGVGMGGSTVLMASGLDLPENVKGIISDSAYSDVKSLFKENVKKFYPVPAFPAVEVASLYVKATQGWSFSDADAVKSVENSEVPVLIIHGGEDTIVPVDQSNDLYEACPVKGSDHLLVRGAMHAQTQTFQNEKYWKSVDEFVLVNLG
ncbi:MAG: alpha/beta hydrolase [Clostridia bacterium]|nr:alpha/beta hydrolase [Clostridia bacterium]